MSDLEDETQTDGKLKNDGLGTIASTVEAAAKLVCHITLCQFYRFAYLQVSKLCIEGHTY